VAAPHRLEASPNKVLEGLFQTVLGGRQHGAVLIELRCKKGFDIHRVFSFCVARPSYTKD
jgi:hypothetical protein